MQLISVSPAYEVSTHFFYAEKGGQIDYYDKAVIGQIAEKSRLSPEYIRENSE